jgi:hypothetical protein
VKKLSLMGMCISTVMLLTACTNDIIRERVIDIEDKYNVLCAFDPATNAKERCTEDTIVIETFKKNVNGIDAKKLIRESDLIEYTKSMEKEERLLFTLHVKDSKTAITYHVTAYADGQFQFPEIGTTEMRYVSKQKHLEQFEQVKQLVKEMMD